MPGFTITPKTPHSRSASENNAKNFEQKVESVSLSTKKRSSLPKLDIAFKRIFKRDSVNLDTIFSSNPDHNIGERTTNVSLTEILTPFIGENPEKNDKKLISLLDYQSLITIVNFIDLANAQNLDPFPVTNFIEVWLTEHNYDSQLLNEFLAAGLPQQDIKTLEDSQDVLLKEFGAQTKYPTLDELKARLEKFKNNSRDLNAQKELNHLFWSLTRFDPKDENEGNQKAKIAQELLRASSNAALYIGMSTDAKIADSIKLAMLTNFKNPQNKKFLDLMLNEIVFSAEIESFQNLPLEFDTIENHEYLLKTVITHAKKHNIPVNQSFFSYITRFAGIDEAETRIVDFLNKISKDKDAGIIIKFEEILEYAISKWSLRGIEYLIGNYIQPNIATDQARDLFIEAALKLDLISVDEIAKSNEDLTIAIMDKVSIANGKLVNMENGKINPLLAQRFIETTAKELVKNQKDQTFLKILETITKIEKNDPEYSETFNIFNKSLSQIGKEVIAKNLNQAITELINQKKFDVIKSLVDSEVKIAPDVVQMVIDKNSPEALNILYRSTDLKLSDSQIELKAGNSVTPLEYAFVKYNEKAGRDKKDAQTPPTLQDQQIDEEIEKSKKIVNLIKAKSLNEYTKDKGPIIKGDADEVKEITTEDNNKVKIPTNVAVAQKFEKIVDSQKRSINPNKPYRGMGMDVKIEYFRNSTNIIEGAALKINEFYDINNNRISQQFTKADGSIGNKNIASSEKFNEKYLYEIEVDGKMIKVSDLLKVENGKSLDEKLAELSAICHGEGAIKFSVAKDLDGLEREEYSCKRDKEHVYVTDDCKDLDDKPVVTGKRGATYNSNLSVHGIGVLGKEFEELGLAVPNKNFVPTTQAKQIVIDSIQRAAVIPV